MLNDYCCLFSENFKQKHPNYLNNKSELLEVFFLLMDNELYAGYTRDQLYKYLLNGFIGDFINYLRFTDDLDMNQMQVRHSHPDEQPPHCFYIESKTKEACKHINHLKSLFLGDSLTIVTDNPRHITIRFTLQAAIAALNKVEPIYEEQHRKPKQAVKALPQTPVRLQAPKATVEHIATGTTVRIHGLKGAAQHNGKIGTIVSFNKKTGRYGVKTADQGVDAKPLGLKPANITKVTPAASNSGGGGGKDRPAP
jgi:hypothetical protein